MTFAHGYGEQALASEAIPAKTVVKWVSQNRVVVAAPSDRDLKIGYVAEAAVEGDMIEVTLVGNVDVAGFTVDGAVWIAEDGTLTQTADPLHGSVGVATSATSVAFDPTTVIVFPESTIPVGDGHTHTNKAVLDGITSEKVAAWDAKVSPAPSDGKLYGMQNAAWTEVPTTP